MERLNRLVLVGGFGLIVAGLGCRTPRSEVPLGPPLVKDPAAATSPVQFSSEPKQVAVPPSMSPPNAANGYAMPATSANLNGQSANYLGGAVPGGAPAPQLMDSVQPALAGSQMATPPRPSMAPAAEPAAAAPPAESTEMPPLDGGK